MLAPDEGMQKRRRPLEQHPERLWECRRCGRDEGGPEPDPRRGGGIEEHTSGEDAGSASETDRDSAPLPHADRAGGTSRRRARANAGRLHDGMDDVFGDLFGNDAVRFSFEFLGVLSDKWF